MPSSDRVSPGLFVSGRPPDPGDRVGKTARQLRQRSVLQTLADALAYAEDVPFRILDVRRLNNIDKLFGVLVRNVHIKALWKEECSKNGPGWDGQDIGDVYERLFGGGSCRVSKFLEAFFRTSKSQFHEIGKKISQKMSNFQYFGNIPGNIEKIEEEISNFIDGMDFYGENKAPDDEELFRKRMDFLLFSLKYVENDVWLTSNSHGRPFHTVLRMNMHWTLLIFSWVYCVRETLAQAPEDVEAEQDVEIGDAFGIPRCLFIRARKVQANHVVVFGPLFAPPSTPRSKTLYLERGLHLRFCFIALRRWLEGGHPDEPTAVDFRSNIMRKSFSPTSAIQRSSATVVAALRELDNLARRDGRSPEGGGGIGPFPGLGGDALSLVGYWAAFLARTRTFESSNRPTGIGSVVRFAIQDASEEPRFHLTAECGDGGIRFTDIGFGRLPDSYQKHADIGSVGFDLWIEDGVDEQVKAWARDLAVRWSLYVRQARDSFRLFTEFRVNVLREWLQRHTPSRDPGNDPVAREACGMLFRLMRADLGVSIYRVVYADEDWQDNRLEPIGSYCTHPGLVLADSEHRALMKDVRVREGRDKVSLCYRALDEDRFVLATEIDSVCAVIAYTDPVLGEGNSTRTAALMPIRLDDRVVGLIEVKSSQPHHFGWSVQTLLANAANILASYLHHDRMIDALSEIVEDSLAKGQRAQENLARIDGDIGNVYGKTCRALCAVFMASDAHLWLKRGRVPGKKPGASHLFQLVGTALPGTYDALPTDGRYGRAMTFDLERTEGFGPDTPLVEYLPKLVVNQRVPFLVFRIHPDSDGRTCWDGERSIVPLYRDWHELNGSLGALRDHMVGLKTREILAFPILDEGKDVGRPGASGQPAGYEHIQGFVVLYHKHAQTFSRNWANTIDLVNRELLLAISFDQRMKNTVNWRSNEVSHKLNESIRTVRRVAQQLIARSRAVAHWLEDLEKAYQGARPAIADSLERQFRKTGKAPDESGIFLELEGAFNPDFDKSARVQGYKPKLDGEFKGVKTLLRNIDRNQRNLEDAIKETAEVLAGVMKEQMDAETEANLEFLTAVRVDRVIRDMVESHIYVFNPRNITVLRREDEEVGKHGLTWTTSEIDFRRIVSILLENAQKYAHRNSVLSIDVDEDRVRFENVSDWDPSIRPDTVFRKGVRGSGYGNIEGFGLGLAIASDLCRQSGLRIAFEQERHATHPDDADFRFTLMPDPGAVQRMDENGRS